MEDKKVTIILPVYHAERFLSVCLDSILKQTYRNWELIAVDDGSLDNSLGILQSYAAKEERIQVISKSNEGVSIARNIALQKATGEYVYFVDADDVVFPQALEILVHAMEVWNATFVKSDFLPIDENGNQVFVNKKQVIRRRYDGKVMGAEKFYKKIIMGEYFLWTCLFRHDIIHKNKILFISHCRLMEDAAFMVDYLPYSERNVYKDACVYGYRKYEGTVSAAKKDYSGDLCLIKRQVDSKSDKVHAYLSKSIRSVLDESCRFKFARIANNIFEIMTRMKITFLYYILK